MISVIIPAYNAAKTIAAALASIETPPGVDVEVIVVDDCSTDGTAQRVSGYGSMGVSELSIHDERSTSGSCHPVTPSPRYSVTPLRLPRNSGPAAARNAGIRIAKGEWIAFLDADDQWLPGKLQAQLNCLTQHPDAVLVCAGVQSGKVTGGQSDRVAEWQSDRVTGGQGDGVTEWQSDRVTGLQNEKLDGQSTDNRSQLTAHSSQSTAHSLPLPQTPGSEARHAPCSMPHAPCHSATLSPCHPPSPCHSATLSPCHSPSSCHSATPSLPHSHTSPTPLPLSSFITQNPVCTSSVLVRKDALLAVGGFDESFKGPEDYDLWLRLASRFKLIRLDAPYVNYRYTAGSLSMDDRKFVPQVLRVLEKAFGDGGALAGHREMKTAALSNQYWNASWMAFNRGDRRQAIAYWWKAYCMNLSSSKRVSRQWWRLLARYLRG